VAAGGVPGSDFKRLFGERPTNALRVKVSYWLGL
jgi:hypothetical protein